MTRGEYHSVVSYGQQKHRGAIWEIHHFNLIFLSTFWMFSVLYLSGIN